MSAKVRIVSAVVADIPSKPYDRHLCGVDVQFTLDGESKSVRVKVPKKMPGIKHTLNPEQVAQYVLRATLLEADRMARKRPANDLDVDKLNDVLAKLRKDDKPHVVRDYSGKDGGSSTYLSTSMLVKDMKGVSDEG